MTEAVGTQSLDRAIEVLRLVASCSGRGIRLVDIVARSGLSKPTAYRLLQGLERNGLVTQDGGDKTYHLGIESFVIGTLASERFGFASTRRTPQPGPPGGGVRG